MFCCITQGEWKDKLNQPLEVKQSSNMVDRLVSLRALRTEEEEERHAAVVPEKRLEDSPIMDRQLRALL